jgi:hypothetical protein
MQKGLVSFIIKSGIKYFEAAPPERIMDYMKEKEEQFNQQKKELNMIIPELELRRKLSQYKSEATVYKGLKGVETAFYSLLDKLKPGEETFTIGAPSRSPQANTSLIRWHKERARRNIKAKIIFSEAARGQERTFDKNLPLCEKKFTSQITPSSVNIAKDRVVIYPESEDPLAISIDSKEIAESFRVQFEMWWNQKFETHEGQEGVEKAYSSLIEEAKSTDEVVIFAAKPKTKMGSDYNLNWNKEIRKKVKSVRLLYYGNNETNKKRAQEMVSVGCNVKIIETQENLPISTVVTGKIVVYAIWGEKPIAFKLENKTVADSLRTNFEFLWNQDVIIQKGWDSFLQSSLDIVSQLKQDESYDVIGAGYAGENLEKDYSRIYEKLHESRIKKGIKTRLLFYQGNAGAIKKFYNKFYKKDAEIKFLPYQSESPVEIIPYGNKTDLIIQEEVPTIITIDNKKIADAFRRHFDSLWNQDTRILRGMEAVKWVWEDMLNHNSVDWIGARGYSVDRLGSYIDEWEKRANSKGFKARNIVDPEVKGRKVTKLSFIETKYTIPKEFSTLSCFWIYGNKVVITNWTEDEPIVIIIENKNLHNMYKEQFEMLWNQNIRILKGIEAIKDIWNDMLNYDRSDFIAARGYFVDKEPGYVDEWEKKALAKGFKIRNIVDPEVKGHRITQFPFAETKYTLPKEFANLSVIWLYGNKVVIANWAEQDPIITIIENKSLYEMYKKQFELLWNQDVNTSKGFDAVYSAWDDMLDELKPGEEYYVMSASWLGRRDIIPKEIIDFHKRRIKKGVKVKFLFTEGTEKMLKEFSKYYYTLGEVRFMPQGAYGGMQVNLFKNKVLMLVWREKEPVVIKIEDENVFKTFKTYFDTMWDGAK